MFASCTAVIFCDLGMSIKLFYILYNNVNLAYFLRVCSDSHSNFIEMVGGRNCLAYTKL